MADSANESDFASAESENSEPGTPKTEPTCSDENKTPKTESATSDQHSPNVEDTSALASVSELTHSINKSEISTQDVGNDETVEATSKDSQEKAAGDMPVAAEQSGGSWGWGGWNSLLSSVTMVTESAQMLGEKVNSVITSVEEGLGLPSPTELAQAEKEAEEIKQLAEDVVEHDPSPNDEPPIVEEPHHESKPDSNDTEQKQDSDTQMQPEEDFTGYFSGFAMAVQATGKGIISGGLDALELLGKKTLEVLSEGDPGLQKKRALLPGQGVSTLSQLLQEAKNQPETVSEISPSDTQIPVNYSRLFDEYNGVVHLEALELLSRECDSKVRGGYPASTGEELERLREEVEELEKCFQVEEDQEVLDDDSSKLGEILQLFSDASLPFKVDKLIKVSSSWRDRVEMTTPTSANSDEATPTETDAVSENKDGRKENCDALYDNGLRSLAEMTSASIELFRKMAELTLLPTAAGKPVDKANKLNRLTVLVCAELDCLASVHSEAITQLGLPHTNSSVTSLYLEASNSGTYVQDAFQLLLPVFQHILVQQLSALEPAPNVLSRT